MRLALICNCTSEIIKNLISQGENVNEYQMYEIPNLPSRYKMNLLQIAATYVSDPDIISLLLNAGATLKKKYSFEDDPIILAAAYNQNPNILKKLIEAGANINVTSPSDNSNTPLLMAAKYNNNPEIITTLIGLGSKITETDSNGNTSLMLAARYNVNTLISSMLIKAGASIKEKNKNGETLAQMAYKNNNKEIIKSLGLPPEKILPEKAKSAREIILSSPAANVTSESQAILLLGQMRISGVTREGAIELVATLQAAGAKKAASLIFSVISKVY